MRRLHIHVEGQTEEVVARDVIGPYFSDADASVTWSIHKTKRPAGGQAYRGGISRWPKLHQELTLLLRDTSITLLTTLFDYYAFPADAPGMASRPQGTPYDRVKHVERALAEAVSNERFVPHLVLHEIESWVLADCPRLGEVMGDQVGATILSRIVQQESGPEMINDGTTTAPSKRILAAYPRYRKTIDGPLVIVDAGLNSIRRCCPHADQWLKTIEARLRPEPSGH
jgi:hypothetical protein